MRMDEQTHRELVAQGERGDASPSKLVNRYVKEGLRMDRHPEVVFRTTATGRRAAVLASHPRLQVIDVVSTWQAESQDIPATARYCGLAEDEVRAVLRYYADYRDEIDDDLAEHRATQENYRRVLDRRESRRRRRPARA